MSKSIRYALLITAFFAFLAGCTTVETMKKEDFSIEKEKEKAAPLEPIRPAGSSASVKIEKLNPLKGKTITLTASNAAFTDVFSAIASRAGLDLVIDSRLKAGDAADSTGTKPETGKETVSASRGGPIFLPPVSIEFNKTPLEEALDNVSSALHIFHKVSGRTLFIKGTDSRTFHLNFLSSQKETSMSVGGDVISSSTSGTSSGSSGSSSSSTGGSSGSNALSGEFTIKDSIPAATTDICTQIESHVKSALSPDGTYSMNRALGFLEVNDRRDSIERIEAYIRTIKTFYNSQVLITAKIIEVALKDKSQYGIDWSSTHLSFNDIVFNPIQQNLALSTNNLTPALVVQAQSPEHGFNATMNALQEFGDIKVLSNPRIRVTNGQPALISVGTNTSYIQEISTTTQSLDGGGTLITPEVTIGSIFDGIMFGVVPNIDMEEGSVNLSITPIKSRIEKLEEKVINDNVYTLPTVGLEEASTQIRVKSGNIIALGGLIYKNLNTENKSVPILGSIPGIGYLFKQETKGVQTAELVILLEPLILAQ